MAQWIDQYADGHHISARRCQKALILGRVITNLLPEHRELEVVDFGCADGAVPVRLLESPWGESVRRITGITLLDYNDLAEKPAFAHPRFQRLVADLEGSLAALMLPWGGCDVVTATAFLHYCSHPDIPFRHAARLLKPGGYLLVGLPAAWVLRLRRSGIPGVLPQNRRIRTIQSLARWRGLAEAHGFSERSRFAIQWCGVNSTSPLELWLAQRHLPAWCGSNVLVIYQRVQSI